MITFALCISVALVAADPAEGAVDASKGEATRRVNALRMSLADRSIEPVGGDPLLRYTDPTRSTNGTVWAWGRRGGPVALLTLTDEPMSPEEGPPGGRKWYYEFTSISDGPLHVTGGADWTWAPEGTKTRFAPAPGAPVPGESDHLRNRQMRLLSDRFAVTEAYMGQSYELRLLDRPIHRYADADEGLVDGAMFAFAHGTNPEAILILEAVRTTRGPEWRYWFARMGSAALVARLDGREVWSAETFYASNEKTTEPYNAFYEPAPPAGTATVLTRP